MQRSANLNQVIAIDVVCRGRCRDENESRQPDERVHNPPRPVSLGESRPTSGSVAAFTVYFGRLRAAPALNDVTLQIVMYASARNRQPMSMMIHIVAFSRSLAR